MARTPSRGALRYISRMDYARTKGWWVRFYSGTTLLASKLFSDSKHDGCIGAREAAKLWRDENELQYATYKKGRPMYTRKNKRNATLTVGVVLKIRNNRKGPARYSWCALWSIGGKHLTKSFGVATYGYRTGYQLALDYRCDMIGLSRFTRIPPPLHKVLANRVG